MRILENEYVYVSVERPPDHLLKCRVVRLMGDWFIAETVPGHQSRYDVSRIVRKTHRDAPIWVLESTGEDVTYYPNK